MYRIDNATAASTKPAKGPAGVEGWYQHGDPATGQAATRLDPDWLNSVQDEIAWVVEAAGETTNKADDKQLFDAIWRHIRYAPHHIPIGLGQTPTYSNVTEYYNAGRVGWIQAVAGSPCNFQARFIAPTGRVNYLLEYLAVRLRFKLVSTGAFLNVRLMAYDGAGTGTQLAGDTYTGDSSASLSDKLPVNSPSPRMLDGYTYVLELNGSWADDPNDFVEIAAAHYTLKHE